MPRNRVIYQSQALFVAPNSTGVQVSGSGVASAPFAPTTITNLTSGTSLLKKLDRIQNANFNFSVDYKDINELGRLSRIDAIVVQAPTVGLDFSYYITDGLNERLLGFNVAAANGVTDSNVTTWGLSPSISGLLADTQGQNFYILTVDEGEDVVGGTLAATSNVVAIGNGFISEYKVDLAVGALPMASVTVEAFNIKADANQAPYSTNGVIGISGNNPAVDITGGVKITAIGQAYSLQQANPAPLGIVGNAFTFFTTGSSLVTALRPGDLQITLPASTGFSDLTTVNLQNFSFDIPLKRTVLQRLGSTFGYARVIDVPISSNVTFSAIESEMRTQNLFDLLTDPNKKVNFTVAMKDQAGNVKVRYGISGAIFGSEKYSQSVGPNNTVDLSYTLQHGGAQDAANGVYISGSATSTQIDAMVQNFYKLGSNK